MFGPCSTLPVVVPTSSTRVACCLPPTKPPTCSWEPRVEQRWNCEPDIWWTPPDPPHCGDSALKRRIYHLISSIQGTLQGSTQDHLCVEPGTYNDVWWVIICVHQKSVSWKNHICNTLRLCGLWPEQLALCHGQIAQTGPSGESQSQVLFVCHFPRTILV